MLNNNIFGAACLAMTFIIIEKYKYTFDCIYYYKLYLNIIYYLTQM